MNKDNKTSQKRKTQKNRNNLARALRFIGRSLLAIGTLLFISIYVSMACFSLSGHSLTNHYYTVLPQFATLTLSPLQICIYAFTSLVILIGCVILLYCINSILRSVNRFIANFFGIPIFLYELAISFTVWAFVTALLLYFLPYAAPYTIIGLILNQLAFCFAYLAYRRPNYEI